MQSALITIQYHRKINGNTLSIFLGKNMPLMRICNMFKNICTRFKFSLSLTFLFYFLAVGSFSGPHQEEKEEKTYNNSCFQICPGFIMICFSEFLILPKSKTK